MDISSVCANISLCILFRCPTIRPTALPPYCFEQCGHETADGCVRASYSTLRERVRRAGGDEEGERSETLATASETPEAAAVCTASPSTSVGPSPSYPRVWSQTGWNQADPGQKTTGAKDWPSKHPSQKRLAKTSLIQAGELWKNPKVSAHYGRGNHVSIEFASFFSVASVLKWRGPNDCHGSTVR